MTSNQFENGNVEPAALAWRIPQVTRLRLLSEIQAFASVPLPTLQQLSALMEEVEFPAGHTIIREGDRGDRLFVVAAGHATATTTSGSTIATLAEMNPGMLFGELALLSEDKTRHATVTARDDVLALTLTDEGFMELVRTFPTFRRILMSSRRAQLLRKFWHVHVLYRLNVGSPRRERNFLASISFFVTFAIVRSIVRAIRAGKGPFRDISTGGTHIHHLVWGILLLLLVGYAWLLQLGTGLDPSNRFMRETAILYGVGSALTLDEFALWLHLEDVYHTPQGRISIDAIILFGSLLSIGAWGEPFWKALYRFFLVKDSVEVPV
jgi:CRP-like cAMP-binding protein